MRLTDFITDFDFAVRAELLARRTFTGPNLLTPRTTPFALEYNITGCGLFMDDGAGYPAYAKPSIVLLREVPPEQQVPRPFPAFEDPEARELLAAVGGGSGDGGAEDWQDAQLWLIPRGELQLSSGDLVRGVMRGTAGAPAEWHAGGTRRFGVLTAGHVVGSATAVTTSGRAAGGTVAATFEPGNPATAPSGLDVAAIELASASPTPRFGSTVGLTALQVAHLHRGGVVVADTVITKAAWQFWGSVGATYLDLYTTRTVVSMSGDSGAAVSDGRGGLAGTHIGSTTGSCFQDARTQFSALAGALPGFTL